MTNFTAIPPVTVQMGSTTTSANAKGCVVLWVSKDGVNFDQRVTLGDVLYVPDFSVNLISMGNSSDGVRILRDERHRSFDDGRSRRHLLWYMGLTETNYTFSRPVPARVVLRPKKQSQAATTL